MLLKSLELKEFGPIKHIKKEFSNTPVIGVIGPNASGKSNLLRSIKYALTAQFEEGDATSYVRDVEEASNATLRLAFAKNSNECRIYRRIGKSPERKIEWDGQSVTADAASKALLKEIFQADGEAVASAVFIEQGQFDKILFGTPTEREELFMKLLLLSHMNKVETAAEKRMKALSSQLVDLGALIDNQRNVLVSAETQFSTLSVTLAQQPDQTELRTKLFQLFNAQDAVAQAERAVESRRIALNAVQSKAQLEETVTDMAAVIKEEADATIRLEAISTELLNCAKLRNTLVRRDTLTAAVNDYLQQEGKATRELKDLDNELSTIPDKAELQARIKTWDDLAASKIRIEAVEKSKAKAEGDLKALQALSEDINKCSTDAYNLEVQADAIKQDVNNQSMQLSVAEAVLKLADGQCGEQCPACQSQLSPEMRAHFTKEYTQQLRDIIAAAEARCKKNKADASELRRQVSAYHQQVADGNKAVEFNTTELQKLTAAADTLLEPADSKVALQGLLDKHTALSSKRPGLQSTLQRVTFENAAAQKELFEILTSLQDLQNMALVSLGIAELDARVITNTTQQTELQTKRAALRNTIEAQRKIQTALYEAEVELKAATTALDEKQSIRNSQIANIGSVCADLSQNFLTGEIARIDALQAARQSMMGEVRSAERAVEAAKTGLAELVKRDEKQMKVRQAMSDMELVKKLFTRRGLPKSYMEYRFQDLIPYTQEVLGTFGADFHITADPDDSLAFRFVRTSQPEVHSLPQFKLSGGQRVRLTIAFLLAVQRVILPEIGLLVLDEPSLHLDMEGKEGLRDLLIGLQSRLRNSEMQLVVCDHEPLLHTAFNAVIDLGAARS